MFGISVAIVLSMAELAIMLREYLYEKTKWSAFICTPCLMFWLSVPIYLYYTLLSETFLYPIYLTAVLLVGQYLIDRLDI